MGAKTPEGDLEEAGQELGGKEGKGNRVTAKH